MSFESFFAAHWKKRKIFILSKIGPIEFFATLVVYRIVGALTENQKLEVVFFSIWDQATSTTDDGDDECLCV